MTAQQRLPLRREVKSLADEIWSAWAALRRRPARPPHVEAAPAPLQLMLRLGHTARNTGRPCKYPDEMIREARRLHAIGLGYVAISNSLEHRFYRRVPKATIRDWIKHYWRVIA